MVTTVLFQEELQPGLPIGDFVLCERIGIGGEGLIFSAWDTIKKKVVAIKFFSKRDEHGSPTNVSAELSMFSRLYHPNIREIITVGETNDFLYSVMHYFPFGSLSDRIFTRTLSTEDALFISVQLASALDFLQKNNIVHRDLKPTNILLNIENQAFLTDFGLAKPISNTTQALHTGHGTPIYAAPEQHTLSKITYKSDLYSFGIMLYEMFTGMLPWGGSVSLAIMQLDNREQLPDPCDSDPSLPAGLASSLRRITSLNPDFRPDSAGEAIRLVMQAFKDSGVRISEQLEVAPQFSNQVEINKREAEYLIKKKMDAWEPAVEAIKINHSHFAFLHSVFSKEDYIKELHEQEVKFMLHGALAFDFEIDHWWDNLSSNQAKVKVCLEVIANEKEKAVKRTITRLLEKLPPDELNQIDGTAVISRLITSAYESPSLSFKQAIFNILFKITKPVQRWHKVSFSEPEELILANLAMYDSAVAKEAAQFIGLIKSEIALDTLLEESDSQSNPNVLALVEVWETAGSLPRGIDRTTKLLVGVELGWKQFVHDRPQLVRTLLAAALAGALGLSMHVFISTRLPSLFTPSRILNTVGSGILFGPIIGIGVFLARWIPQRLLIFSRSTRVILGTILGGFLISLAIMLFHISFLQARPIGPLITLGSLILAAGFATTNQSKLPVWVKILGGTLSTAVGLTAAWLISLNTMATPMLYYIEDQPLETTLLIALFSVALGGITYVFNFREKQEEGLNHE